MSINTSEKTGNGLSKSEREAMLMSVQNMIEREVRNARVPDRYFEDAAQELRLEVWAVTAKFDPTRGVKWSTYACSVMKNTLKSWTKRNKREEGSSIVFSFDNWDSVEGRIATTASQRDDAAEDEAGDETVGALTIELRRYLTDAFLSKLPAGHRRLVEQVAFEGLTAEQIAIQNGHPLKAVRVNLKSALRKLCAHGLTSHIATDAEVAAAVAPQTQIDRVTHNANVKEREHRRVDAQIVSDLDIAATKGDAFKAVVDRLEPDMKLIVQWIIERAFTLSEAAELLGVSRCTITRRLNKVARDGQEQTGANEGLAV